MVTSIVCQTMLTIHQGHEFLLALERVGLNAGLARQVVENAGLAQDLVEALQRWAREGLGDKFFSESEKTKYESDLAGDEQYRFLEALVKVGLDTHLAQVVIENSKVAEAVVCFLGAWWPNYHACPNAHWESRVKKLMKDIPAMVRDPHKVKVRDHKNVHWHICHCHIEGGEVFVLSTPLKADGSILMLEEEMSGIQPAKWQHRALPLKPGMKFVEFETPVKA